MTPACRPSFEGTHWTFPGAARVLKAAAADFDDPDDIRSMRAGWPTLRLIGIKRLGAGQFYLITIKDKDGEATTAPRPIACTCRRMCRSSNTGR